jgi:glucose-specific phosphotransferase system IIA component
MIGDGFAMKPESETVVAPVSGRLIEVAEAKHAYYIETVEGIKVLIHVGLDTLLLNGEGFEVKVSKGMTIKEGQPLVTFDSALFKEKGYHSTIPVIVLDDQARSMDFHLHTASDAEAGKTLALDILF